MVAFTLLKEDITAFDDKSRASVVELVPIMPKIAYHYIFDGAMIEFGYN